MESTSKVVPSDFSSDYCEECQDGGELIVCEECKRSYHRECHEPSPTNYDMEENAPWYCCECIDDFVASVKLDLTEYGHLKGCDGGRTDVDICCSGFTSRGQRCRGEVEGHSCLSRVGDTWYGWCHLHRPFNETHISTLSFCANELADKLELTFSQRYAVDQSNIEERLGLSPEDGHISYERMKSSYELARDHEWFEKYRALMQKIQQEDESSETPPVDERGASDFNCGHGEASDDDFDFDLPEVLKRSRDDSSVEESPPPAKR